MPFGSEVGYRGCMAAGSGYRLNGDRSPDERSKIMYYSAAMTCYRAAQKCDDAGPGVLRALSTVHGRMHEVTGSELNMDLSVAFASLHRQTVTGGKACSEAQPIRA